ncbi:hypothetical protein YC2023_096947 [Brassica napus]
MHLLFIRQPFYVGDEVEIEEVKMYVEELRLMETVFKGIDKQYQYLSNFGLYDKLLSPEEQQPQRTSGLEDRR